jgi:hypothetical protein
MVEALLEHQDTMSFTREQGRAALTYIIVTVMNQPEDGPMAKSLTAAQIDNVEDLGTLLEADIENLSFIALVGAEPTPMGPGQRGNLRAFIAFIRYRSNEDNPIGDNWNEITREEFSTYQVGPSFNGTIFGSPSTSKLHYFRRLVPDGSAAFARHHLLPFGNYTLHYLTDPSLERMGSGRMVPDGSIRSPPPTPIWKLHVTLFSRSFPREDGE